MVTKLKGRHLKYEPSDEHILRRLGGALVVHWDTLNELQRETLLSQAIMMGDRDETVQLREQIALFIKKHKATD
jgi:hypothetical protein